MPLKSASAADLVLASAPFFMVALAELTKIPIATLLFSVKWIWKPVLLLFLMLLAAITFETVFMGLERATTLRQLKYQGLVEEKRQIEFELASLARDLGTVDKDYAVQQTQANIESVSELAEKERASILSRIEDVDKQMEGQVALTPEAATLRDRLNELEARREGRLAEQSQELKDALDGFAKQRDSYVERMKSPNASTEQMQQWGDELRALRNPGPELKARFATEISNLDQEISRVRDDFERMRAQLSNTSSSQRPALEERRKSLLAELDELDKKWSEEKEKARLALSAAQSGETDRTQKLASLLALQTETQDRLRAVEANRVAMARSDQVQRIAGRVFGKNPEDVGPDESSLISLIWFGSLAALAALAGPITAMVALGLQRIGLTTTEEVRQSKLPRLIRNMLLSWRWKRVRTKEVKVEVPVPTDAPPQERIIKEILYVPILTDNPQDLKRALSKDLPPEIADLVKVGVKESDGSQT